MLGLTHPVEQHCHCTRGVSLHVFKVVTRFVSSLPFSRAALSWVIARITYPAQAESLNKQITCMTLLSSLHK